MKNRILSLFIISILTVFLTGCGTVSMSVKAPFSELVKNKNNSYVVFVRPYNFMGGGNNIDIMEFSPENFSSKAVADLANVEKVVYPVHPGKSYFFSNVSARENITMVDLKPGEIHYINMGVTLNSIYTPIHIDNSRIQLANKILKNPCSKAYLNRYLFEEVPKEENKNNIITKNSKSTVEYQSPFQYKITCDKEKIIKVLDMYHGVNMSEINNLPTVKPNDKYIKEIASRQIEFSSYIKTLYPIWNAKLKNMPISENPVGFIYKEPSDKNFKQFKSIKTEVKLKNKKIEKKSFIEFKNDTLEKFSEYKNIKGRNLKLVVELRNFDDGSMIGRYFTSGLSASGYYKDVGVLDFYVSILDDGNQEIGAIRLTTMETFGILGGINTMVSDTLGILKKYIENNYIITE